MLKKFLHNFNTKKTNSVLIKRFLKYANLFINKNITLYPETISEIKWEKILVLTPHADDETLGCGGLLIKASQQKKDLLILLYSDNSNSILNENKDTIINIRFAEFENAMQSMNIKKYTSLNLSPNIFYPSRELVLKTEEIIKEFKPEIIILPSFIDNHEEHKILNIILSEALKRNNFQLDILLFEVWSAINPNILFDITDVIDKKIEAIKCYESQLKYVNYIDTIIGLNRYRSITNIKGNGYCEGFLLLKQKKYIKIISKYL